MVCVLQCRGHGRAGARQGDTSAPKDILPWPPLCTLECRDFAQEKEEEFAHAVRCASLMADLVELSVFFNVKSDVIWANGRVC